MTAFVQEKTIEETSRRIGALGDQKLVKLQRSIFKFQPEVAHLVIGLTGDLRPDAVGLSLYLMVVIIEAFRRGNVRQIMKVDESALSQYWDVNEQLFSALRQRGVELPELLRTVDEFTEPDAVRYAIEALTEVNPEDPVELSSEEAFHITAVLMTAIEALHDACRE